MFFDFTDFNWIELIQTNSFQIPNLTESKIVVPNITAKSSLIYDINKDKIIYQNNKDKKLPIASLTKLMTAYVILKEHNENEIVTITEKSTKIDGSTMKLRPNEKITIKELLHGLLISSGNDAAYALAIENSKRPHIFVKKMNKIAKEIGMHNTNFTNPAGLDIGDNYSTAEDLLKLSKKITNYKIIQEISKKESYTAYSKNKKIKHYLKNTNSELNNFLNIKGLKTGKTPIAKECFIGITEENNPKISIIIGSNNRFQDTKTLLYILK